MTSWQERLREIEATERQRVANQQAQTLFEQQEEQLRLQRDGELKDTVEKQDRERKIKFFGVLDSLQVRRSLEDIRQQVWQGRGVVIEDRTDVERFMRLSFDYRTTVPEIEKKEWDEVVGKGYEHTEFWGGHDYNITEQRSKTRVVKRYDIVKSSYLEVGVKCQTSGAVTFYILDTEVELPIYNDATFSELAKKAGGVAIGESREIQYTDANGKIFNKEPHPKDYGGYGWLTGREVNTSYSLAKSHYASNVAIVLPLEPDMQALENFTNYGLALSCWLRTSQGKLPLQLK